jgi:hypothetical protein
LVRKRKKGSVAVEGKGENGDSAEQVQAESNNGGVNILVGRKKSES